jgi:hypothetical protein
MEPTKTVVKSGKYTFQITDNTLFLRGEIYSRNFKIGGHSSECGQFRREVASSGIEGFSGETTKEFRRENVNVSISYKDNIPSAYIPYVVHDPMCSIDIPLDSGRGTIVMIKTLLNHIHTQIPTITEVKFEDKSNIECATDIEISKKGSRFRKQGTHIYPIPLYYFSIAFNGETWYEKHFNARQKNSKKHDAYKLRINTLLNVPETKSAMTFLDFCRLVAPPMEILEELNEYYERADTFGRFFQSIPKPDRCRLVREWIAKFMSSQLKGVFDNSDWIIDLPTSILGGGKRTTKKRYYCPKGRVYRNATYKDFGVGVMDV